MQELSDRQRQVMSLITQGRTVKEAALVMGIAVITARKHINKVTRKLKARTTIQAAAIYASRHNPQAAPTE